METLLLTISDTRAIVQEVGLNTLMDAMIARLTHAFETFSPAKSIVPMREGFNYTKPHVGLIEWMPIMEIGGNVTVKMVGYHPENPEIHGLPTILGTISAYDTATGHLIGIVDGVFPTALRTGAASAVASRELANPHSKTLGLIGCGAQAVSQAHALSRVFDFDDILIYDTDRTTAENFHKRVKFLDMSVVIPEEYTPEFVAENADILCTVTSVDVDAGAVFEFTEVKPWLHVNAVGADFPGKVELPNELLRRSFVVPDHTAQAKREGECQQLQANDIGPELVEMMQNRGKFDDVHTKMTVFDSTGYALEDQVALELFLDFGEELGLGTRVQLEGVSAEPKDPYHFLANGAVPSGLCH